MCFVPCFQTRGGQEHFRPLVQQPAAQRPPDGAVAAERRAADPHRDPDRALCQPQRQRRALADSVRSVHRRNATAQRRGQLQGRSGGAAPRRRTQHGPEPAVLGGDQQHQGEGPELRRQLRQPQSAGRMPILFAFP